MRIAIIAAIGVLASPALALDQMKSMSLAHDLGTVLASEELCGLSYDQNAIAAYVEKRVPADDMGFAGTLDMMTTGAKISLADMSASSKTAHCVQIRRVAKNYGFTK